MTLALDIIEQRYEPGVVITTSGIPKVSPLTRLEGSLRTNLTRG